MTHVLQKIASVLTSLPFRQVCLYGTIIAVVTVMYSFFQLKKPKKTAELAAQALKQTNLTTLLAPLIQGKCAVTGDSKQVKKDLREKNVVLFFYPKDGSPICTLEAKKFAQYHEKFKQLDTILLGVSRDTLTKHKKFKTKYALPFELITDQQGEICKNFHVLKNRKFIEVLLGVLNRSTFLFDAKGTLRQEWRNVKVKGHIEEVFQAVKNSQPAKIHSQHKAQHP